MNYIKTVLLLGVMSGIFLIGGFLIGGQAGMMIALVFALGMNLWSYWNADKMVLRMHGAVQVDAQSAPEYYALVAELAERAQLPMPAVYIVENDQPNAFATGRNPENSAVAATTGLMRVLNRNELAGVMAHELAHIKNRDTLIMTITATIAGALSTLAQFASFSMMFGGGDNRNNPLGIFGVIAAMILAPLSAMLVQMAISRTREYAADQMGAIIADNPRALASALVTISKGAATIDNEDAERHPATAHMFIINPLHGRRFDGLFSTHPNTQNRVDELLTLEKDWQGQGWHPTEYGTNKADIGRSQTQNPWARAQQQDHKKGPWG